MYNTDIPNREELPSTAKLIRSTIIAAIVALVLLVTVYSPGVSAENVIWLPVESIS